MRKKNQPSGAFVKASGHGLCNRSSTRKLTIEMLGEGDRFTCTSNRG
ncbi:hypothetical protein [Nostoc sp.]